MMNRRIVVIHQPHFLPWLGYFNKLAWANVFVAQDDVQFRRRYFQNRTLLKSTRGAPIWLTLPVHARRHDLLQDVTIVDNNWRTRIERTLLHYYRRAPFYDNINEVLIAELRLSDDRLVDTNVRLIRAVLRLLRMHDVEITLSSSISRDVRGEDRAVELSRRINATHYLFGEGGGAKRHSPSAFVAAGIVPLFQDFRRKQLPYPQQFGSFVPNLSVIDALYNIGPAATANLVHCPLSPLDSDILPATFESKTQRGMRHHHDS